MSLQTPDLDSDKEVLSFIEGAVSELERLEKEATALRNENAQLKTVNASLIREKVILEKVATSSPFSQTQIDEIMAALGPSQFIAPQDVDKVAAVLAKDTVNVVALIKKMAASLQHYSQGIPIPAEKQASDTDPDGWGNVSRKAS